MLIYSSLCLEIKKNMSTRRNNIPAPYVFRTYDVQFTFYGQIEKVIYCTCCTKFE